MNPDQILDFWLDEVGPKGWYARDDALDQTIRDRFGDTWEQATEGGCGLWLTSPSGSLAYVILTDQFPRNMFRDDPRAFSTDKNARAAAKIAVTRNWDLRVTGPIRQFFYMPLVHSENLIDQDRAIRLICSRMPEDADGVLLHAKVHRELIRRYGRFPGRNDAMGRESTAAETAFFADGGYGAVMRAIQSETLAA